MIGLGLLVAACGDTTTTPPSTDGGVTPLIPVTIGNQWVYRVTSDTGVTSNKTQTITGTAATAGGSAGFRFETVKGTTRETVSVQSIVDGVLLRYEEMTFKNGVLQEHDRYVPSMVRIDANRVKSGEMYQTAHVKQLLDGAGMVITATDVNNRFEVESAADVVEVPAGRFSAVRVRRVDKSDGSVKTYWYVPGLGKVKEIGGQTEELVSADVAD